MVIREGFWQWLQRGSVTFRGDLGSGLTPVALGKDSTVVDTVTAQTARGMQAARTRATGREPRAWGPREGLTWERRGRKGGWRRLGFRGPAPRLQRAPHTLCLLQSSQHLPVKMQLLS